jgi:hypothetical protein
MLACSIPLTVRRVEPAGGAAPGEVKGVRYLLKRPTTTAGVRPAGDAKLAELRRMGTGKPPDCQPYRIDLSIDQEMDQIWVYEAEYTPNFLADTDATVTLQEDGTLAGISAGETDQILPFVQAVAGLAISAATATKGGKSTFAAVPNTCRMPALQALVDRQIALLEAEERVRKRIESLRSELGAVGTDYERIEKHLLALSAELERIKIQKGANKQPFAAGEAVICVDGRHLGTREACKAADTGTLVRIDLETRS